MFASVRGRSRRNSRRQIDLGDPQRPRLGLGIVLEPLADVVDVGSLLAGEVALDQFVHLVERDQRADRLASPSPSARTRASRRLA